MLSKTIEIIVKHYFKSTESDYVLKELNRYCELLINMSRDSISEDFLLRVSSAIVKVGGRNIDKFSAAVKLAESDWRDILVKAKFANSPTVHENWIKEIIQKIEKQKINGSAPKT